MKTIFLTVVCGLAICSSSARASTLSVVFDQSTLNATPGGMVSFGGNLMNETGATLFLNGDDVNIAVFDPSAIDDSPFFINTPTGFLDANVSTGDIGLFNISIPNGFSDGVYNGTYEILGGESSSDNTVIGTAGFTVTVGAQSSVPEPSSSILLLAGSLLILASRRRSNARRTPAARRR